MSLTAVQRLNNQCMWENAEPKALSTFYLLKTDWLCVALDITVGVQHMLPVLPI